MRVSQCTELKCAAGPSCPIVKGLMEKVGRTAARPPWGTATGGGHAHAAPDRSPRAI
jgi:hypothetical protein